MSIRKQGAEMVHAVHEGVFQLVHIGLHLGPNTLI